MKTLIVKYLPRTARSKSKMLLDAFREEIADSEIEELDLCSHIPDMFTPNRVEAYYARNITHQIPSTIPIKVLAEMDSMTAQLKSSDVVVVAFPMYNFSMPAVVKAWFDSVMLHGETFEIRNREYIGLMTGKKALALVAAGGIYSSGNGVGPHFGPGWEHALSLAKTEFQFMGFSDIRGVLAEGMVGNEAIEQIQSIAQEWYGPVKETLPGTLPALVTKF
jgi:FMN-dependent NADH-azoreductase